MRCLRDGVIGFFNLWRRRNITRTSKHIYFLCVGELTDIMWARHLLCGRVCCGRINWLTAGLPACSPHPFHPGLELPWMHENIKNKLQEHWEHGSIQFILIKTVLQFDFAETLDMVGTEKFPITYNHTNYATIHHRLYSLITLTMTLTVLILAVCRTPLTHQLS